MSAPRTRESQINALLDENLEKITDESGKTVYRCKYMISLLELFLNRCIDQKVPAKNDYMEVYKKIIQEMPELEYRGATKYQEDKQSWMTGMTEDHRKKFAEIVASSDLSLREPKPKLTAAAETPTNTSTTPRIR